MLKVYQKNNDGPKITRHVWSSKLKLPNLKSEPKNGF